jgi:serine/threonine-protein kinase
MVYYHGEQALCLWVSNPRFYEFQGKKVESLLGAPAVQPLPTLGMEGKIKPQRKQVTIKPDNTYLLCTDGLDHQAIYRLIGEGYEAHSRKEWRRFGEETASEPDWAFVVFPIEQQFSYLHTEWPYDPFKGAQEELAHEKRGLALIADALFRENDFQGFRIIGGLRFTLPNATRRLDGTLVSPWGVVLLELKDHRGDIRLDLTKLDEDMEIFQRGKVQPQTNPVRKLTEILPHFKHDIGVNIDLRLRKIGAIVFTNPRAQVHCVRSDGSTVDIPARSGDILIVTPDTLAEQLRRFVRKIDYKYAQSHPPLNKNQIQEIIKTLSRENVRKKPEIKQKRLGRYSIELEPDVHESTDYYEIFVGVREGTDKPIWAKHFHLPMLSRGNPADAAMRIGREIDALQDLNLEMAPGVQHYLDQAPEGENSLFVILEYIAGKRLDTWLKDQPERSSRIALLQSLAKTLAFLAAANIVHRALSPANIRVQEPSEQPVLINFELCQMEHIATLPLAGRRLFDLSYMAPETNIPGGIVTPAADVYSFGKIVCLVLSGQLPFENYQEQEMAVARSEFWQQLAQTCGNSIVNDLKRILSLNPHRRPVGAELINLVENWQ